MNAPTTNREGKLTQMGDPDFFAGAILRLGEELAVSENDIESITKQTRKAVLDQGVFSNGKQ